MPMVSDIVAFLDAFAPPNLAADWDNVGLLLGSRSAPVQRIITCLTVTPESAAEAVAAGAQLLVSHHPVLFRATRRLTDATPEGRTLLMLLSAGVAVYSPHTAYDNTRDGINDQLARLLGLRAVRPLRPGAAERQVKVVVFVPDKDLGRVSDALFAAGAGQIGEYRDCSFRQPGTGTFFGSAASNPTIGQAGRREEVSEWRLEVICPEVRADGVIAALRQAHSYEEPAYDVYPLRPAPPRWGEGRCGDLDPTPLRDLAQLLKTSLSARAVQIVGQETRVIRRAAVVCGAGGDLVADAVRAQVDVLITGEARFHDYLAANAQGLALLLPGHYASERLGAEELARRLQGHWPDLEVWASRQEADPVTWI
jgi:dinuclear metal center YbgI/SA1388 family protein